MKVILCENIENLGGMGETVKVANGYARNYLIPRKMAVTIESASAKQIEHELAIIKRKEERMRGELEKAAKTLESVTVELTARAGEEDKLFGSITTSNIADKLKELGHEIDRRKLILDEPIKSLGVFMVPLRLASGIEANIKVWVSAENVPEEEADKPAEEGAEGSA